MYKLKILKLVIIGTGFISNLSFANPTYQLKVRAVVEAPPVQYILFVDGKEADSINIDLGRTLIGKQVNKEIRISIRNGNTPIMWEGNIANSVLEGNEGTANLTSRTISGSVAGSNDEILKIIFNPTAAGTFTANTTFTINPIE